MAKTANVYARMEPELKEQAEHVLNAIGLAPSSAITMFYKQIILQQGLPFEAKLNYRQPLAVDTMTKSELDAELQKGYQSVLSGNVKPAEEVFDSLRQEFDL